MKTYKGIREEWYQTFKLGSLKWTQDKDVKIYKNPTMGELKKATKTGYGAYRALLESGGNMYAWGDTAHLWVSNKLYGKEKRNVMPIQGTIEGGNKWTEIKVSIEVNATQWNKDYEAQVDFITNHRHMLKLFKNEGNMFLSRGVWG